MTNIIAAPTDPIADLWALARAWLGVLMTRFGGPVAITAALGGRTRAAIKRRLAVLDALLLKLLLIEAARAPLGPAAPRRHRAAPTHLAPYAPEDEADPETWRVRYRPRLPHRLVQGRVRRAGTAAPAPRPAAALARALARRCEALRRVLDDPRCAISALARKLHALGRAAADIARRIAMQPAPRGAPDRMRFAHAIVHAADAGAAFGNTS